MFSDGLLEKSAVNFQHFLSIPFLHQNNALSNPIQCVLLLIGCDARWWHKGCCWEVCANSLGKHKSRFAIVPMGARCCRREAACGAVKQFDIVIIFQLALAVMPKFASSGICREFPGCLEYSRTIFE